MARKRRGHGRLGCTGIDLDRFKLLSEHYKKGKINKLKFPFWAGLYTTFIELVFQCGLVKGR